MEVWLWVMGVLVLNTLMGAIGVIGLWIKEKKLREIAFLLMSFAAGTLLGGAFLHLIPHAMEHINAGEVSLMALAGFVLFFIFENALHWHRCKECELHPYTITVLIGDAIHNIFDGIVVALTFILSIPLGIATSIAILAHEIPQELGIFGVMVHGNVERKKAIIYSVLAQATSILGGILGLIFQESIKAYIPPLLPFVAGGFIYIASSDLVPEIHKAEGMNKLWGIAAMFVGIALIAVVHH